MIIAGTKMTVADNSGATIAECIHVNGSTGLFQAYAGDVIVVSIKSSIPGAKAKKGDVHKAVVVRTKKSPTRKDGMSISFDDNAVVIVDKNYEPLGTRVMGPVAKEVRSISGKIVSLAEEVF